MKSRELTIYDLIREYRGTTCVGLVPFDKRFSCGNLDKVTTKLPRKEIIELQNQHNVNLCDDNGETWFDDEIPIAHVTVIDEDEFFNRYFGENYDVQY